MANLIISPSATFVYSSGAATDTPAKTAYPSAFHVQSSYSAGYYHRMLALTTSNNNVDKPKVAVWGYTDGSGSKIMFGTSNNYATGVTNTALTIGVDGFVGVGLETPLTALDVINTTSPQLRVGYDGSNYMTIGSSSAGAITLNAVGASAGFTFSDAVTTPALSVGGVLTVGDASGDTVTVNSATWTFANDTNFVLSGGVNGLSFDTDTFSVDATNNRIGLGTTAPDTSLHIVHPDSVNGGIQLQSSLSNSTNKSGRIKLGHYTTTEEPITIFLGEATSSANILNFGGGSGAENAATEIRFRTAATTTTLTGTTRMTIDSAGDVGIGNDTPLYPLHVGAGADTPTVTTGLLGYFTNAGTTNVAIRDSTNNVELMNYVDSSGGYIGTATSHALEIRTANTARVTVASGGNFRFHTLIGINMAASGSYWLELANDSAAKPGTNTWTISSDERVKDIKGSFTDGLDVLLNINPIKYEYNGLANTPMGKEYIGIIAQEMEEIAPYTVGTYNAKLNEEDEETTELKSFDSNALTYVMINAIKELDARLRVIEEA